MHQFQSSLDQLLSLTLTHYRILPKCGLSIHRPYAQNIYIWFEFMGKRRNWSWTCSDDGMQTVVQDIWSDATKTFQFKLVSSTNWLSIRSIQINYQHSRWARLKWRGVIKRKAQIDSWIENSKTPTRSCWRREKGRRNATWWRLEWGNKLSEFDEINRIPSWIHCSVWLCHRYHRRITAMDSGLYWVDGHFNYRSTCSLLRRLRINDSILPGPIDAKR